MTTHYKYLLPGLITILQFMTLQAMASETGSNPPANHPPSKRIEVYNISQNYWDVSPGDTLSNIVMQLLPYNSVMRKKLSSEIIKLNPHAFVQNQENSLKANVRLWLPNHISTANKSVDKDRYNIKSFSWGQINTPKGN